MFTVGSMFAGIGGICLGFKQAGFDIVWANEKDPAACKTYRHNFGNDYLVESDIKKIDKSKIPRFDVLTAGFPCQPFSVAGKQRGFLDVRGNLFFQIVEVAKFSQPKIIFLENVANLIEHDDGKTFITIFNTLSELGYIVKYRNLSSDRYGNSPQTRDRTYVVAFKNEELCNCFKFPEKIELRKTIHDIIDRNKKQKDIYYYNENNPFYNCISAEVRREDSIYRVYNGKICLAKNNTCPTLTASMGIKENCVPLVVDDFGYRRLTVKECLEFQGFPETYSFPIGTTINEAYKQVGNSVCVTVVKRIAEKILIALNECDKLIN